MSEIESLSEDPWLQYLPELHRTLVSPEIPNRLPRSFISLDHGKSCAWWETLRYMLRSLLGWKSVPAGLAWWYEAGKPSRHDPRLQLVIDRWDTRRELDYFAAREWVSGGFTGGGAEDSIWSVKNYEPNPGWMRELQSRPHLLEHNPYGGGSNPLHLSHSDLLLEQRPIGSSVGCEDLEKRRATLIVSGFDSWQQELRTYGNRLPQLKEQSWKVEVFDRKVGFLGLFRRSRVTNLWFQGKHSIHMAGNSQANALKS